MATLLDGLKRETNYTYTENNSLTHKSTLNKVLDLFALGGSYNNRSDDDCVTLFKRALKEDESLALKCLFYLRDVISGQGCRRFFRICYKWLAKNYPDIARRNHTQIAEYGRFDDLIYCLIDTPLEEDMLSTIYEQLNTDILSDTPSLCAKWMPSINCSSKEAKRIANIFCDYFYLTPAQYRKMLSKLRKRINVLERLMSANEWNNIEFDKIPSRAGMKYRNCFMRRAETSARYRAFMEDTHTTVNASVLDPVNIAREVFNKRFDEQFSDVERAVLQKYWDNLKDYYNGREENGIAVVDVSGSMIGTPLCAAVSMGAYIAERGHGPFANHFITFSREPELVEFEGVDIVDKFQRCAKADWGYDTNIQAVFELLLDTAIKNRTKPADMPSRLYIFSDMEFDEGIGLGEEKCNTLLEAIAKQWKKYGYELPSVIFWNLDARQDNIPALEGRFSYISGFSMNMIEAILSGKTGYDLMLEKLLSERYEVIR